jgi:glyoxylase I family protein
MQTLAVHHVSVNVPDVDEAIAFYVGVLGMTVRDDRPDLGFPGAWLDAGDQQVHLLGGNPPANLGQHFAIRVEDIEATIAELRGRGIKVTDSIPIATNFQAFLQDPAGNGIEIHQVGA